MQRIGPITRKPNFHSKEKCLIGLVLITLCLLCFGGIFLLPDNFGGERVLRVYKQIKEDGRDFLIPAPPLAHHASKEKDPHFENDRKKLQEKIKAELGDLLDNPQDFQQELGQVSADDEQQRQNLDQNDQQQGAAPPHHNHDSNLRAEQAENNAHDIIDKNIPVGSSLHLPMGGGAESNPSVQEKRQKVKEVNYN